ncbi:MAG: hypothetical protein ACLFT3_07280 [Cyclobacteriaceae bacterium]
MKKRSLYNRVYDHSFSLLISFSFYSLFLAILLSCEEEDALKLAEQLSATSSLSDKSGNTYAVGYQQVSSNNQDAFVEKKDKEGNTLWKVTHASSPADERAVLITLDEEQNPWVVFTVDGGSYDAGYITKKSVEAGAFENVYQNSYGQGGGPKVAIIARLNPETGRIVKASFLTARLNSGKTNSFTVEKLGVSQGKVTMEAKTAAWPPAAGKKYVQMPDITDEDRVNNAFLLRLQMDTALSEILSSELRR